MKDELAIMIIGCLFMIDGSLNKDNLWIYFICGIGGVVMFIIATIIAFGNYDNR